MRVIQIKAGLPSLEEARRALLVAMARAERERVYLLKVVHGYGSGGSGGTLAAGIRRSLRLRAKEGRVLTVIPGEQFSCDANVTRALLERYPSLRHDPDLNRMNPGITIIELARPARPCPTCA